MVNKQLIGAVQLFDQAFQVCLVPGRTVGMAGILMGMGAIAMGQDVGPLGTQRNLNPFDGVQHQQSQLTIKDIEA